MKTSLLVVLLFFVLFAVFVNVELVTAQAETIVVPDDYQTIADAVENVPEGATIFVKSGVYDDVLLLNKSLSLIGENLETTVINGHNEGPVVYILADGVNVTGFTILNGDTPSSPSPYFPYTTRLAGVHVSADHCNITHNKIVNSGCGVWLYGANHNYVVGNVIADNSNGIRLELSSGNAFENNTVTNSWDGISFDSSGGNTLRNNVVSNVTESFDVSGGELQHFVNDVDSSNTVDGMPFQYLVNQKNLLIDSLEFPSLDFIVLVNCTNITVQNFQLPDLQNGIHLAYTTYSKILQNTNSLIQLDFSSNNTLVGNSADFQLVNSSYNKISNNNCGISLHKSSHNLITGNRIVGKQMGISLSFSSCSNHIEANDIKHNSNGFMFYSGCNNNSIIGNNITANADTGIWVEGTTPNSCFNTIIGNNITENVRWGILLRSSSDNTVCNNNIADNKKGLELYGDSSKDCLIVGNNFTNNDDGVSLLTRYPSKFYHNNFIGNTNHVVYGSAKCYVHSWDNGYLFGGNYWSTYAGVDIDNDGIGDTSYYPCVNRTDDYPLMAPVTVFDVGTWEWTNYNVTMISNSTVSCFRFSPEENMIQFSVDCETGTTGFCRIVIPKDFLYAENKNWLITFIDGSFDNVTVKEDVSNSFLYFSYSHEPKTVEICGTTAIPEFSSFVLLSVTIVVMLVVVVVYRKVLSNSTRD